MCWSCVCVCVYVCAREDELSCSTAVFALETNCNYRRSVLFCVIRTADLWMHQISQTTHLVKLLCLGRGEEDIKPRLPMRGRDETKLITGLWLLLHHCFDQRARQYPDSVWASKIFNVYSHGVAADIHFSQNLFTVVAPEGFFTNGVPVTDPSWWDVRRPLTERSRLRVMMGNTLLWALLEFSPQWKLIQGSGIPLIFTQD